MLKMDKDILFTKSEIQKRVSELARQIDSRYAGRELVIIGVLNGAFIFMADLVRSLQIPCTIDFIRVASYGYASESSGTISLIKDIELDIQGRDVLLVEDIIDTGLTLNYLVEALRRREPASLAVCAFLDKRLRRKVVFEADYVGFSIDDGFIVGYGLDYNEKARCLPDVYIVKNL